MLNFVSHCVDKNMPRETVKCKFSDDERVKIFEFLKSRIVKLNRVNKLKKGAISEAVAEFQCSRKAISAICNRALKAWESGEVPENKNPDVGHLGRKPKSRKKCINRDELQVKISRVPMRRRQNIRSTVYGAGVSTITILNLKKKKKETGKGVRRATTTLKPLLTPENMIKRVEWCAFSSTVLLDKMEKMVSSMS